MAPPLNHPWNLPPAEARALQERLRPLLITHDAFGQVQSVAGTDLGFEDDGRVARAAVVVLEFPSLRAIDQALVRRPTPMPYIPGLLSFREIPALLDALACLRRPPDLLLCDGAGYAHPRRLGLAAHLGLYTGIPSIGVAKSRLIGAYEEPGEARGAWSPLVDQGEIVGAALRTRARVSPLFVSGGHRVGLMTAMRWVLHCCTRYRLPETTRAAHRLASG